MHPVPVRVPNGYPEPDHRPQLQPEPDPAGRRIRLNLLRHYTIHLQPCSTAQHHRGVLGRLVERHQQPIKHGHLLVSVVDRTGHGVVVDADLSVGVAEGPVEGGGGGGGVLEVDGEGGDVEAGAVGAEDEEEEEEEEGGGKEEGEEDGADELGKAAAGGVADTADDGAGVEAVEVEVGWPAAQGQGRWGDRRGRHGGCGWWWWS